ncbi:MULTISPECIES: chemotaxis protein [unclassified Thermosipho (in: thermotogales)]|uniref:chemotaxis protein n=1 Tax=unclassified Thermosipho (in: thermotogales) TaxID=2676525 RepID=UPI0009875AF4|nr:MULTISPECIES: chemotaxis protein [unclassified Thermosipho (in: thermotogales)]MBT1248216.1 chemotaxis protein [Thermosipho sp. 1244]OOC46475.1 chemotaxis protein [Thermosipho sp. 1223]
MKNFSKLSLALSICFLVIVWLLATTFVIPFFSRALKETAVSQFEDKINIIAKTKAYDVIFKQDTLEYYYLISKDGITLNHNDKSKIGKDFSKFFPDFFKYMQEKKEGTYEYVFENKKKIAAFAFDGENFIVAAVNEDDLFPMIKKFKKLFYTVILPLISIISITLGYVFGIFIHKKNQEDFEKVNNLFKDILENIVLTSSSTAEIKSMAENTENAMNELDKSVEDFAAFIEETTAEIETSTEKIKDFTAQMKEIIQSSAKLANLTDVLGNLTEKITDISDTITVLAINASIETSKEAIDREGLSRIAEMIMELSNSTRELAKNSKESLSNIEKIITSNILISEKASKEILEVNESLNAINEINNSTIDNIDKITKVSKTTREATEELYSGLEQVEDAIEKVRNKIQEFEKHFIELKRGG